MAKGPGTNSGTKIVVAGNKMKPGGPKTGLQHTTKWPKLGSKGK
jgi:hypothetical protein